MCDARACEKVNAPKTADVGSAPMAAASTLKRPYDERGDGNDQDDGDI